MDARVQNPDTVKLGGWLYIPLKLLSWEEKSYLRKTLVYRNPFPRNVQNEQGEWETEHAEPIILYDTRFKGHIGVPRAFGLHRYGGLFGNIIDSFLTDGSPMTGQYIRPDPNHSSVRNPQAQAKFMEDLFEATKTHNSFLATAPTGSGKTVSSLDMAVRRGRTTLVMVHLERLMDQWINEALVPLLGCKKEDIGILQGPKCDFEGKDFVVGMLHSLNLRKYPREFYRYFGTIIFDEVHKVGCNLFAPSCPMFTARVKVGLSATPKRADGGEKVFMWHLGPVQVVSTAENLPMKVYVRKYSRPEYVKRASNMGSLHSSLSKDSKRNSMIAGIVKRMYDSGRSGLIVGHSVRHLQVLMEKSMDRGVPKEAMGQFTRQEFYYATNDDGKKVLKKRNISSKHLTFVKENAKLIFATYGMMTEGIDIPRLDAGLDVVPQGRAKQLIGRVRRPMPGKKEPVWVTILDTDVTMAKRLYKGRLKDYRKTNAEVVNE